MAREMPLAIRIRRLLVVCMAVLATAALSCCAALGAIASGHIDIDSTDLQSRIAAHFPARYCKTPLLCVELSNPLVALNEGDDRIGLALDVKFTLGTRERAGRIGLAGRPRYVASQGQLFLDDFEIKHLDVAQLSAEYVEWVQTGATLLARHALQDHPVYTLDDSTAKGAFEKRAISDVRVIGGKLRVTFASSAQ